MNRLVLILLGVLNFSVVTPVLAADGHCPGYLPGEKHVYWGDLHLHTAYSMDAWGYGTFQTPADAYRFAKGGDMTLSNGSSVSLQAPLDFLAVTDHAEWFDILYLCTDPAWSDHPYCDVMTDEVGPVSGREIFAKYVLGTVAQVNPGPTEICRDDPQRCEQASAAQWRRIQKQTNAANDPCNFTALNAFEWSATPEASHTHRNIIFKGDDVTPDAIDYLRYPSTLALWQELDKQCDPNEGCDVVVIPHNTNMGDGKGFDVELENPETLALRAKYETLIEIHQQKGSSECLYAFGQPDEDCNYELYLVKNSRDTLPEEYTAEEWGRLRNAYVRELLGRGISVYQESGLNPLQMGIIGATDSHTATPGFVAEDEWQGSVFALGDLDAAMTRLYWNPGGITGVWAEENTRDSIFAALKRREVFATSGPRIPVRLEASTNQLSCEADSTAEIAMGAEFSRAKSAPWFRVEARYDQTPLVSVELIRVVAKGEEREEQVIQIWNKDSGAASLCQTWQDSEFDPAVPTLWYARIKEAPKMRWSAYHCRSENRCDEFPGAESSTQDRAWTSPIWYLP